MKIRKGFVSNSSTSSFVCEICGHSETFYDGCSVEDYGFRYCENGYHLYCIEHIKDFPTPKELPKDFDLDPTCPLCTFQVISIGDMKRYLKKITEITEKEVFEEIKSLNKRRRRIYDFEYIEYALRWLDKTEEEVVQQLRDEHKTLDAFHEFYGI